MNDFGNWQQNFDGSGNHLRSQVCLDAFGALCFTDDITASLVSEAGVRRLSLVALIPLLYAIVSFLTMW
jgi:hypothetical protein